MATITLQPGERFAHTHDVVSTTKLLEGEVEFTVNGVTVPLTRTAIVVPPDTPHVMRNVGVKVSRVECGYGTGDGDEDEDDQGDDR